VAAILLLAACSKGGGPTAETTGAATGGPSAACSPAGTELTIVAKDNKFDQDCLAAPADQRFTIRLNNEDSTWHNIEIYSLTTNGPMSFFKAHPFTGPKAKTFEVDALSSGLYYFTCDVHPTMNGMFVVA
jgi:plastocyanin